jgi:hypothetical protein
VLWLQVHPVVELDQEDIGPIVDKGAGHVARRAEVGQLGFVVAELGPDQVEGAARAILPAEDQIALQGAVAEVRAVPGPMWEANWYPPGAVSSLKSP